MSLELFPQTTDFWDEAPRDLVEALTLARIALNEIEAAYARGQRPLEGRGEPALGRVRLRG